MRPVARAGLILEQVAVLDRAASLPKPGGRIAYITCSVLPQENNEQVRAFVSRHPGYAVVPPSQVAAALWDKADEFIAATIQSGEGLMMIPRRIGKAGSLVSPRKRSG